MTAKVTDEMLMAYVDGELEPTSADHVRVAIERDPQLAGRADRFRLTRSAARDAYADVALSPAPARLTEAIFGASSKAAPSWRRSLGTPALPLAASVALLLGLGGYWLGLQQSPTGAGIFADQTIAGHLASLPSGESRSVATTAGAIRLETTATYRVDDGLCRSFRLQGDTEQLMGVGCTRGERWRIELAVPATFDRIAPASAEALAAIEAFLDAAGAGDALTPDEERKLQAPTN